MTTTQQWFTVEEAANYLRVSKRTIYKLTQSGRLAAFTIGEKRHRRFRKKDLDKVPQASDRDQRRKRMALTAKEAPVLAELWDNELDAIYDTV